ncbi:hypothetical protein SK128_002616, partial [Halocaridina rubra]
MTKYCAPNVSGDRKWRRKSRGQTIRDIYASISGIIIRHLSSPIAHYLHRRLDSLRATLRRPFQTIRTSE